MFCNLVVGVDASQLYPDSVCQPMSTGLYIRYESDADLQSSKPCKDKSRRKWSYPTHNDQEQISKMKTSTQQELRID